MTELRFAGSWPLWLVIVATVGAILVTDCMSMSRPGTVPGTLEVLVFPPPPIVLILPLILPPPPFILLLPPPLTLPPDVMGNLNSSLLDMIPPLLVIGARLLAEPVEALLETLLVLLAEEVGARVAGAFVVGVTVLKELEEEVPAVLASFAPEVGVSVVAFPAAAAAAAPAADAVGVDDERFLEEDGRGTVLIDLGNDVDDDK